MDKPADPVSRVLAALANVLPQGAFLAKHTDEGRVNLNGIPVRIVWATEGWLNNVRRAVQLSSTKPDIIGAPRMSPGAAAWLRSEGIGWIDETGAAEIAMGTVVIARSAPTSTTPTKIGWRPSVLAVAETILCGTRPIITEVAEATTLSRASCQKALRFLADQKLLQSDSPRGRESARSLVAFDSLLNAYAAAAVKEPRGPVLHTGVLLNDPVKTIAALGTKWTASGKAWAVTSTLAASVLAPYLSSVTSVDLYLDDTTMSGLEASARNAGLASQPGGRLALRPFPTTTSRLFSQRLNGLCVAPWPRVYADLRVVGVRGEEAAEHLREIMSGK